MFLTDADVEGYRDVVAKAVNWLHRNHAEVVALPDVSAHYKTPYLYAATGERRGARQRLELIIERYLQPDGDFRTHPDAPGWPQEPAGPANRYVYADAWLVMGFQRLGFYGVARKGLEFLLRFQDPGLGGFHSRFDPATGQIEERYLDVSSTSVAGLALLACGQFADAVRAGNFVLRVLDSQPDWDRHYFTSWDTQCGLMTDVFGDDDIGALRGRKQFCVSADSDAAREPTWMMGLAMTFLSKLFDTTGDSRFLEGAGKLFDFFHRMDEARWENPASCKIMWGSAELYRLTGELRYFQTAKRILDFFCTSQCEWGGWVHTLWFDSAEEQPFSVTTDFIQELCGEINDTVFNLSEQSHHNTNTGEG